MVVALGMIGGIWIEKPLLGVPFDQAANPSTRYLDNKDRVLSTGPLWGLTEGALSKEEVGVILGGYTPKMILMALRLLALPSFSDEWQAWQHANPTGRASDGRIGDKGFGTRPLADGFLNPFRCIPWSTKAKGGNA